MNEHIVKSYEEELALLDKKIAQMGGLAEQLLGQSFEALERRDPKLAEAVVQPATRAIDASRARDRGAGHLHDRAPPADGRRPAPHHGALQHRGGPRAHRRPRQEHRQARARDRRAKAIPSR